MPIAGRYETQTPADGRSILARIERTPGRYCTERDVTLLAADPETRLTSLLVRMGGCRFTAAAQDVATIIAALEKAGDYCRDVSLIATADAGELLAAALAATRATPDGNPFRGRRRTDA